MAECECYAKVCGPPHADWCPVVSGNEEKAPSLVRVSTLPLGSKFRFSGRLFNINRQSDVVPEKVLTKTDVNKCVDGDWEYQIVSDIEVTPVD